MVSPPVVSDFPHVPAAGDGSVKSGPAVRSPRAYASFLILLLLFVGASCVQGAISNALWSFDLDSSQGPLTNTNVALLGFVSAVVAAAAGWILLWRSARSRWTGAVLGLLGAAVLVSGGLNNLAQSLSASTMETPAVMGLLTVTQPGPYLLPVVVPTLVVIAVVGYIRPATSVNQRILRILSLILLWVLTSLAELFSFGWFYSDGLGIGGTLMIMLLVPLAGLLAVFCLGLLVWRLLAPHS